jgi:hypothetical protein
LKGPGQGDEEDRGIQIVAGDQRLDAAMVIVIEGAEGD